MANNKQSGTVVPMPREVRTIFNKIVKLIEAERDVRPAEHLLIHQLSQALLFNQKASEALLSDGFTITSDNGRSTTVKENPALKVLNATANQILNHATKLGLDKVAFDKVMGGEVSDDSEDPLEQHLEQVR